MYFIIGLFPLNPGVQETLTVLGAVLIFSALTWVGAYGSSITSRFEVWRSLPPSEVTSQVYSPASEALASAMFNVPSSSEIG